MIFDQYVSSRDLICHEKTATTEMTICQVNARCLNLTGYLAIFSLVHLEPIVSCVEWTALRYPKG